MTESVHTPLYERFREKIIAIRKAGGLSQRELAQRLGREHSFVARIELGERRLDLVEFYWLCIACKADPERMASQVMETMAEYDPSTKLERRKLKKPKKSK